MPVHNGRVVNSFLLLTVLSSAFFAEQPARTAEVPVAALTAFTADLEKCQDIFVAERHWGKKPLEIERLYFSRPKDVVWRSTQSGGIVEFSSSVYVRVPKETAKKYARMRVAGAADLPIASDGIALLPSVDGFPIRDTQFRYEFEPRPDGIRLVKISRSSPDGTWQVVDTGHPCVPKPK
jgi:hypothetical protein